MYNIDALENMIATYDMNIKSFSAYVNKPNHEQTERRLYEIVANRRLVAAMIENGGEPVFPPKFRNGDVFFDTTLYQACNGVEIY
jgi:hypothetical protein